MHFLDARRVADGAQLRGINFDGDAVERSLHTVYFRRPESALQHVGQLSLRSPNDAQLGLGGAVGAGFGLISGEP